MSRVQVRNSMGWSCKLKKTYITCFKQTLVVMNYPRFTDCSCIEGIPYNKNGPPKLAAKQIVVYNIDNASPKKPIPSLR
jgi:hypothetical protein